MKKSIICMLLSLLLVFTAMPVTAGAAASLEKGASEIAETGSSEGSLKNVRISDDGILSWDPFLGATCYYFGVYTGGGWWYAEKGTMIDLHQLCIDHAYPSGTFDVRLEAWSKAGNEGGHQLSERWEGTYTFVNSNPQLSTPTNLRWEGTFGVWDAVPDAGEYVIWLYADGVRLNSSAAETTYFNFASWIVSGTKSYTFTVHACGNGHTASDDAVSSAKTFTKNYAVRTITFDANGGSVTPSTIKTDTSGWLTADLPTPTRTNYTFVGWTIRKNDGPMVNNYDPYLEDTTLYAKWTFGPISHFVITGITEPVAGESPDVECLIPANCGYRPTIPNYGYISWYNDDGNLLNPDTDRFKAGEKYSAQVTLIPTEGYEFAESGLTGTMNGKDTTKSIWVSTPKKKITMSRLFTCAAPADDLSGTVTSFLNSTDETTISFRNLTTGETGVVRVTGNSTTYSIPNLPGGRYMFYVAKPNHVNRTYTLVVGSAPQTLDYKIHPIGDINGDGKITTVDYGKANSHARGKSTLSGYEFSCADVNADSKVSTADAGRINAHAKGKSKLW